MISNAPLERLINTVMALDGLSAQPGGEEELRCLMRKIAWVAAEAETALGRCLASAPEAPVVRFEDAA